MRKVMSLMFVISGLSMGCGDSDTTTSGSPVTVADAGNGGANGNPNGNGNGNPIPIPEDASAGGEPAPLYPKCDRVAAAKALGSTGSKWTGPAPFTESEFMACGKLCENDMAQLDCFRTKCGTAGADFVKCFSGEQGVCAAGSKDALCRTEFENIGCCATEKKCNLMTDPGFEACLLASGPCAGDLTAYQGCASGCQDASISTCVSADPPGGGTGGGGTGGGGTGGAAGGGAGGRMALPAAFLSGAIQAQFSAR